MLWHGCIYWRTHDRREDRHPSVLGVGQGLGRKSGIGGLLVRTHLLVGQEGLGDLRLNRLMVVLNSFEHLKHKGAFDPNIIQRGEAAALRAGEIVTQLMHFSRLENALELQPVQIKKILQDAIGMTRKIFDKKITLIDKSAKDLPWVSGDENQLQQVFLNLLLNARDALEASQQSAPFYRNGSEHGLLPGRGIGPSSRRLYLHPPNG